ncbi:EAL domain-containing protein [Marinimicrobium sp. C2-29]|uniref:EAL domain-containing protein n=1 Tax=Marinimicrobium sp. C2-29 TaxID=3139825 RepID=UPI0031394054
MNNGFRTLPTFRPAALACLLLLPSALGWSQGEAVELRVGVYHNPPKIFLDDEQRLSGILGDLLHALAEREAWELEPVSCVWPECLALLEAGEIDLMPDVARNQSRAERFDFHETPALLSWSQLYQAEGAEVATSLLDLENQRLAVLNGSVQQEYLLNLFSRMPLEVQWVTVDSLDSAFRAVREGRADAVATNQYYGNEQAGEFGLTPAPVMFQPSRLYFAAAPGQLGTVQETIDDYLDRWRADPDSPYFEILRRWEPTVDESSAPSWIWWTGVILVSALVVAMVFGLFLRRQVSIRTRQLRASEARLNTILNSVEAHIYIKDRSLRYQYGNRQLCELLGTTPESIVGKTDEDFFDSETCKMLKKHDQWVLEKGERFANEEVARLQGTDEPHTFLSVKIPLPVTDSGAQALCGISTDITEHRNIQEQLHQLAYFDPLTRLPNRRLLLDRLHHAQISSAHTGFEGALVVIDLDSFKTVNDTLGHDYGDQLLRESAERLQRHVRSTDTVGRLGADEFVIIVEDLCRERSKALMRVRELATDWLEALARPFDFDGVPYVISSSAGVVMFSDTEANTDAVMKGADLALFAAKSAGRNRVQFFNPAMQVEVNRRTRIESALRRAIESEQLALHVQPQVDSHGRVLGMEALLRWQDPELGFVSPGEFIPIAEACGLIIPLGEWVVERACDMLAQWSAQPALASLILAVNISPAQFRHPNFVPHIEACLQRSGINPALLELEVTESLLIDEMEQTIERMVHLRQRGVRFALDDFGTGYASLAYLKRLPLHLLKIDQSFVNDVLTDPNDEAIVRTIIALGESLELSVIAEGVETEEQAKRLQGLGCTLFQGYFYGRPAPVNQWIEDPRLLESL